MTVKNTSKSKIATKIAIHKEEMSLKTVLEKLA